VAIRKSIRQSIFHVFKDGGVIKARFRGPREFTPTEVWPAAPPERVISVDTESLPTRFSPLTTVLVPVGLHDRVELLETPYGQGMAAALFKLLCEEFGVKKKPSVIKKRGIRHRFQAREDKASTTLDQARSIAGGACTKCGRSEEEHQRSPPRSRRETLEPVVVAFYNAEYDLNRLFADRLDILRAISIGTDTYRVKVGCFDIEVDRMHISSSNTSFELVVRDSTTRKCVRLCGIDLSSYWKGGLAKAAESLGAVSKQELDPSFYQKPREEFTYKQWQEFRNYACRDAETTREVYLKTAELLISIDPGVVRRNGLIPISAPGAAARIIGNVAFEDGRSSWTRPYVWADQLGADAYLGGRSFCAEPGLHRSLVSIDLKSAYPFAMCLLPCPASSRIEPVGKSEGFNLDKWRGKFGVLVIDGESLDDVYPPFRIHDATHSRLQYVFGKFKKIAVTIPEVCIGVASGSLRVDRIHKGVWIDGSSEESFLRKAILRLFAIKEDKKNGKSLRALAKLLMNSFYGKLLEVMRSSLFINEAIIMQDFKESLPITETLARIYAMVGPDPDELLEPGYYWGEKGQQKTKDFYKSMMDRSFDTAEQRSRYAIYSYVEGLSKSGEPSGDKSYSVRDFVRKHVKYTCGHYFMPLYGSQITGLVSGMLGAMSRCTKAVLGDTDSAHVKCPSGDPEDLKGFSEYFEVMAKAGYPSPRKLRVDGKMQWVGGVKGGGGLGGWEVEIPPSVESVCVRLKLYSHRYRCREGACDDHPKGGGVHFKQAEHGWSRFTSDSAEVIRASKLPLEERAKRAQWETQRALHEALMAHQRGEPFQYQTRASPRKLKASIIGGGEVGEFIRRLVKPASEPDPNVRVGRDGVVRWLELAEVAESPGDTKVT
jgi:hypothetical protein